VTDLGALLGTELRRFFSRRLMRGAFAFGIALSTMVLVIITVRSDIRTTRQTTTQFVCPPGVTVDPSTGSPCGPQSFTAAVRHDHRIRIHDNLSKTIAGTGVAIVMFAFVIGASFIGAEFGAGSLGSQLIFEPRRVRVVVVKAIAVGIGLALLAIALLLYIALLQWAGSSLRGVVSGLDGQWFAARAGDTLRVAAAVGLAGTTAFAVTVVARRTVAAVAGLLVLGYVSAIFGNLGHWRWITKDNPTNVFIALVIDPHRTDNNLLLVRAAGVAACIWAVGLTAVAAAVFARREAR
jgi:hypothetical protein